MTAEDQIKELKNEIDRLKEIIRNGPIKIADLPFSVKITSSIYISEPFMYLPPKYFSEFEKKFK